MNILETQFRQRKYDGKWEQLGSVFDTENAYIYTTDSGNKVNLIPLKWITIGVYDYLGELE